MKRLYKKGFSLAELLVVLVIIAIITTVATRTIKIRQNNFNKLAYIAHDTLVQAAGNAFLNWSPQCANCEGAEYCWSRACWNWYIEGAPLEEQNSVGGIANFPREYPGFLFGRETGGRFDGTGTDRDFCRILTRDINTIDKERECNSFISGTRPGANFNVGQNFLQAFCAVEEDVKGERKCSGTGSIIPSFIAANGMKFYISSILTANPSFYDLNEKLNERMMFRLVVVDLNGANGPNSQFQKNDIAPDLVLFAIRTNGTVVPMGILEYNLNYLNAIVQYPEFLNEVDPDNDNRYRRNTLTQSSPMTLKRAKSVAYAGHTENAANTYYGEHLLSTHPYSFSSFLQYIAMNCSPNGCNGNPVHADDLLANLVRQFLYTSENSNTTMIPQINEKLLDINHGCTANGLRCKIDFTDER